jgi:hypothetical protein
MRPKGGLVRPPKVKGCSKPRSRCSVISSTSSRSGTLGQNDGKLVTAQPRQNVTRTQLMLHAQGRFLQVEISGEMPELVVDLPEIVEVDIPRRRYEPSSPTAACRRACCCCLQLPFLLSGRSSRFCPSACPHIARMAEIGRYLPDFSCASSEPGKPKRSRQLGRTI